MSALLVLTACAGSPPAAHHRRPPSAPKLLTESGHAMGSLKTVTVEATFPPGVTYQGFKVASLASQIKLPQDSQTTLKVRQGGLIVGVQVIQVAGTTYVQLPFSGFAPVSGSQARQIPTVAGLFNPQSGLPAILPQGRSPTLLGSETVGGQASWKVSAIYSPAQVSQLLAGLSPSAAVQGQFWIGKRDHLIRQAIMTGPFVAGGGSQSVVLQLSHFNQPVQITTPTS